MRWMLNVDRTYGVVIRSSTDQPLLVGMMFVERKDLVVWGSSSALWNVAAVGKLAWNLAAKAKNLWVRWISGIYLKEEDF